MYCLLDVAEGSAADKYRACLGESDSALAIHDAHQLGRNSSPKVYGQTVAWTHHIVRTNRQVHWDAARIAEAVAKHFGAKSLRWAVRGGRLDIKII